MKTIHNAMMALFLVAVCSFMFVGCAGMYSQSTQAELLFDKDGHPQSLILKNNKSYSDLKIDVTKKDDGTYELHYSAAKTDSNGAVKAVAESNSRLAETVGNLVGVGATLVAPVK